MWKNIGKTITKEREFYALIIKKEDYFIFLIGNDGDGGIFCTLFLSFHKRDDGRVGTQLGTHCQ